MRIFLDTADPKAVRALARWGCFAGVTTNPILLARARLTAQAAMPALAEAIGGEIFAQAGGGSAEDIARDAAGLAQLVPGRMVIKIPATPVGLEAMHRLADQHIPVAATAIFRAAQALMAARAGAIYAIPFWHRIAEAGGDPVAEVRDATAFFE